MYVLKPFFYNDFHCIGSECPYTCCGGWQIYVDKETYKRYEQYEGKLKKIIENDFIYVKESGQYRIQLNGAGMCPLCDEEQLCMLIKEKGEDALSSTCKAFPRIKFMGREVEEQYLSLGCPAAVAFLKERKEPLSFLLEEDDRSMGKWEEGQTDEERLAIEELYEAITVDMDIRNHVIDLLQDREYPLWFREFFCGYCLDKIKEEHYQGKKEEIYDILEEILQPYYRDSFMERLDLVGIDERKQFALVSQIVAEFQDRIAGCTFFGKMGGNGTRAEELLNRNVSIGFEEYKTAYDKWRQCEGKNFDILMEHVAAYNWMQYAMKTSDMYYMLENYWNVVLNEAMIKYFCIIYYSIHDNIDWEVVEFIIAFISRIIYHAGKAGKENLDNLKKQKLLSIANMYVLVRF